VAALRPAAVVYREEQNFDWRVYALLAFVEILAWVGLIAYRDRLPHFVLGIPLILFVIVGLLVLAVLVLGVLRMTTEATPTTLRVWFGWIPIYRRAIMVTAICRVEVVTYRPITDHGGWGIRLGRDGERVLTARGNRGVKLELTDGSRLLVGSQRPEELAQALERAMTPGV